MGALHQRQPVLRIIGSFHAGTSLPYFWQRRVVWSDPELQRWNSQNGYLTARWQLLPPRFKSLVWYGDAFASLLYVWSLESHIHEHNHRSNVSKLYSDLQ